MHLNEERSDTHHHSLPPIPEGSTLPNPLTRSANAQPDAARARALHLALRSAHPALQLVEAHLKVEHVPVARLQVLGGDEQRKLGRGEL